MDGQKQVAHHHIQFMARNYTANPYQFIMPELNVMRQFSSRILLILLALLASPQLLAQPQQPGPWVFSTEGGVVSQSDADLEGDSGSFDYSRWFAGAGLDYLWSPRTALGISFGGGQSRYGFKDVSGLGDGDPWSDIEDYRVSVISRFAINEKVSGIVIPSWRVNRESGASTGDSQTWGLLAGVSWRLSDTLTLGPGIGVFDRLEESTAIFPILVIDWDISERWNLSTGRGLAASQGPGLTLAYQATNSWSLGVTGRYEQIDFRLDDTGPAPGGVGRDEVFPLVFSAAWSPSPGKRLSLFAGAEFGGELELADAGGTTIANSDYDAPFIFGGSFSLRF